MPTPKAILLDFDGTLVDSEPLHHACWCEAVEPWGGGADWEDYRVRFVGITDTEAGRILLSEAGHEPTDELVRAACERKHGFYRARCGNTLVIPPATVNVITQVASDLLLGVVSSSITSEVVPVLEKVGLATYLHTIVCGDQVTRHKPHPEPYHLAVRRLNSLDHDLAPSDCLVFEDSRAGIAAAKAAGTRVRPVNHPDELANLIAGELPDLLPQLQRSR